MVLEPSVLVVMVIGVLLLAAFNTSQRAMSKRFALQCRKEKESTQGDLAASRSRSLLYEKWRKSPRGFDDVQWMFHPLIIYIQRS